MGAEVQYISLSGGWEAVIYREWSFPTSVIEAWDHISSHYGDMGIFISYGWFENWWQAFGDNENLLVIVLLKRGEAKAVFPCCIKRDASGGTKNEYISSLTNDHTCYYDFIIHPEVRSVALSHFIHLSRKIYPKAQMYFEYMHTSGDNATLFLNELNNNRMPFQKYSEAWAPWTEVSGDWLEFQHNLSSRLKNTLRKCRKKAEGNSKLHFEIIEHSERLDDLLDILFQIEYNNWKGRNKTAIKCQAKVENFYRQLAHWAMGKKELLIFMLTLEEAYLATVFCLYSGETVFALKAGYDESFGHLSPGNLLYFKVFNYLFNTSKIATFNFLGAYNSWKMEWNCKSTEYGWIKVYPKSLNGWMQYSFHYGWKNFLKQFPAVMKLKVWIDEKRDLKDVA